MHWLASRMSGIVYSNSFWSDPSANAWPGFAVAVRVCVPGVMSAGASHVALWIRNVTDPGSSHVACVGVAAARASRTSQPGTVESSTSGTVYSISLVSIPPGNACPESAVAVTVCVPGVVGGVLFQVAYAMWNSGAPGASHVACVTVTLADASFTMQLPSGAVMV